jgi:hypothetical protein
MFSSYAHYQAQARRYGTRLHHQVPSHISRT